MSTQLITTRCITNDKCKGGNKCHLATWSPIFIKPWTGSCNPWFVTNDSKIIDKHLKFSFFTNMTTPTSSNGCWWLFQIRNKAQHSSSLAGKATLIWFSIERKKENGSNLFLWFTSVPFHQHSQLPEAIDKALHLQWYHILLQHFDTILHFIYFINQSILLWSLVTKWIIHAYLLCQQSCLHHQILCCHSEDHWLVPKIIVNCTDSCWYSYHSILHCKTGSSIACPVDWPL